MDSHREEFRGAEAVSFERSGLRGALKMWTGLDEVERNVEGGEGTSHNISQAWLYDRITLGSVYKIPKSGPTPYQVIQMLWDEAWASSPGDCDEARGLRTTS